MHCNNDESKNEMPPQTPSQTPSESLQLKDSTFSMTYSITIVTVKTVIFSLKQEKSNTHLLTYIPEQETYLYSLTETYFNINIPYIIYSITEYCSPSYMQLAIKKGKMISPEKLIGIICGSVALFFIILVIIIFFYRKKKEFRAFVEETLFSSEESEDYQQHTYTGVEITDYNQNVNKDDWI